MQWYWYEFLDKKYPELQKTYIESTQFESWDVLLSRFVKNGATRLVCYEVHDHLLKKRISNAAQDNNIDITWLQTPTFLLSESEVFAYFKNKQSYFQTSFYKHWRQEKNILLDTDGSPVGGKWSYDTDNRKKLSDKEVPPIPPKFGMNNYVREAKQYVQTHFPDSFGKTDTFIWGVHHGEAKEALHAFLDQRLQSFGTYQDAITQKSEFTYHSLISLYLNVGLLTPDQVLKETLDFASSHNTPLNSLEGFIRQVLGWREFIRAVYLLEGEKQRKANFFSHANKLNSTWYKGKTGLRPVDDVIQKVSQYGYAHHIERLMILGNAMLLSEIDPDQVYTWFMEVFIDAYDWVMVPNVYGMSQFADGGLMVTKPYISASNYILKMSDYHKDEWAETWDSLYWSFLAKHSSKLSENPRMKLVYKLLQKKTPQTLKEHKKIAKAFLRQVTV